MANPGIEEAERSKLTRRLMTAGRAVRDAKGRCRSASGAVAHRKVDTAKRALGERGSAWWTDGAPDFNRHMAKNTLYANWYAGVARLRQGGF
jgi:hypothetical protein